MPYQIKCKGRWSVADGKALCKDKFEYFGEYGDKELIDHQEKEKSFDCKQTWWTGFENDQHFENVKSSYDNYVKNNKKS
jgi:hypothetical protein|tara:strand:- start:745 stop:981 length:237 start_codon:yes stop_codon:yes gene_type:complete